MGNWIQPQFSLLVICLFVQTSAVVWGQENWPHNPVSASVAPPIVNNCFGIMGQVHQPGIYQFPPGHLNLARFTDEAGGLTEGASGSIRIIRQGKPIQQVFLGNSDPRTTMQRELLLPGDLVVVEERSEIGQAAGAGSHNAPRSSSRFGQDDLIEVALLNVLPRPIIVELPPQEANIESICQRLQPKGAARPVVKVLLSGFANPGPLQRLNPGAVLVFEQGKIQQDRLPPLPPVLTVSAEVPTESIAPPSWAPEQRASRFEADSLRAVPAADREAAESPVMAGPSFGALRQATTTIHPSSSDDLIGNETLLSDSPGIVNEAPPPPPLDSSSIAESAIDSAGDKLLGSTASSSKTRRSAADGRTKKHATGANRRKRDELGENTDSPLPGVERSVLTAIVGCAVLLLWSAVVLFWLHARRPRRPVRRTLRTADHVEPGPREELNELEVLIRNRLPVVERPISLPESLEFHGRPAIGWRYRFDPAHVQTEVGSERPAPHINHRAAEAVRSEARPPRQHAFAETHRSIREDIVEPVYPDSESAPSSSAPAMSASQDYAGFRHARFSAEAAAGRGLLDRVLATVQGTAR